MRAKAAERTVAAGWGDEMIRIIIAALLLAPMLANCTTLSPEQVAAQDQDTCSSYGFKPGTDAFAQCRLELAQGHHIDDIRQRAAIASGLQQMSDSLEANRPRTCNANTFGSGYTSNTTVTCY